jgi:hypothetical protein
MSLLDRLKAFFRLNSLPPAPRRLDGRSKALLAASFNMLPDEEPGWITMTEAATLFSSKRDAYAFCELDEVGKANLAAFASASGALCLRGPLRRSCMAHSPAVQDLTG